MKNILKNLTLTAAALVLFMITANAADTGTAKGGGQKLIELSSPAKVVEVQTGDVVVMTCPKCKTVTSTKVKDTAKGGGSAVEKGTSHGCPGCGVKVETSGHGKGKEEKITHVCTHCGSKKAFCSVLKKKDADAQ